MKSSETAKHFQRIPGNPAKAGYLNTAPAMEQGRLVGQKRH
jgi:hypothetical protein